MIRFCCSPDMARRPAALMILGAVVLLAACGSGGNGGGLGDAVEPEGPMVELGEWNTQMEGSLDVSDANQVLRAYYDAEGDGKLVAAAPVQPAGTGTATWSGMWSGKVELNPDPLARAGLGAYGVDPDNLAQLGGGAQVTAVFEGGGVMAQLTYRDFGLDELQLSEITLDQVAVADGRFKPQMTYSDSFDAETANPFDPTAPTTTTHTTIIADLEGEGAFGGADAAGVAGYLSGGMVIDYGRGPTSLGTLQSVFYGTRDER